MNWKQKLAIGWLSFILSGLMVLVFWFDWVAAIGVIAIVLIIISIAIAAAYLITSYDSNNIL